jgi:hypothetical protein
MKTRKKTSRIIFHHSLADKSNANEIRNWHIDGKGWADIGYHFVVLTDGTIEKGRELKLQGAHAFGKNHDSIGVCLEGDFHKYEPLLTQLDGCARLYHDLCRAYQKNLRVEFHRPNWFRNACPGKMLNRLDFLEVVYRANPFQ